MSRKPTIKISYPDASDVAMKLTEAMVRRAPGRRVVETTSEDSASPAGGELFADFDACSTSTSVDLTLTLNSASMDYALETLIRPNLTTDERKRILGEDADPEQTEMKLEESSPHAGQAPGQALDGDSSADVPSAERDAATQSGKQETCLWMAAALGVLLSLTSNSPAGKKSTWRQMAYIYLSEPEPTIPAGAIISREEIDLAFNVAEKISKDMNPTSPYIVNPEELLARVLEKIKPETQDKTKIDNPSWGDIEAEARKIGQHKTDKTDKTDKTGEDAADQDIEPGLLNDIKDGEEGGKE